MFHFTANLKPYTFTERPAEARFGAYLLSADYAGPANLEVAATVRDEGRLLVADNGNVDLLREFAARFKDEAKPLDEARRLWEREAGHYARPGELPRPLQERFVKLAHKIAAASQARITEAHTKDAVSRQRSMHPDFLIGMEDLTLGTMAALNLEPEYAGLPASFFQDRARAPITWATRTRGGDFGPVPGQVLTGLHALDFDSAVLVGQLAAEAGLSGIAVGLFGALTDRNYVDYRVEDRQLIELPRAVPRPYLRVIELSAGLLEGYRRAGEARPAFHALGVGTPILLPLLALLSAGEPYFATDSTAPIVDGWSSPTISLYVDDPAPLKYRGSKIAEVWIKEDKGWTCSCLDCQGFRARHPPQIEKARAWWKAEGKPKIRKQMLERDGPLSAWLPFLGYPADDDLRREAGLARVGHNHTVLKRLQDRIRRESKSQAGLQAWVQGIVEDYAKASTSKGWVAAVREACRLATDVAQR